MAWNYYQKPSVNLPIHHHKDDAQWIGKVLQSMSEKHQLKACVKYNEVYLKALDKEPLEHRKDGRARVEANTRLRNYANAVKLTQKKITNNNAQISQQAFNISDL